MSLARAPARDRSGIPVDRRWGARIPLVIRVPVGGGTGAGPFHSLLYRSATSRVPQGYYTLPIGKARVVRAGLSWSSDLRSAPPLHRLQPGVSGRFRLLGSLSGHPAVTS